MRSGPSFTGLAGLLATLVVLALPVAAAGQQVVVGRFSDRTGHGSGRGARNAMAAALAARGATLSSHSDYLRTARRMGYHKARAYSRRAIRKVARRMGLAGVVTGRAERRRGRTLITVELYGPNGRLWMRETVSGRRSSLSRQAAGKLADQILHHLGPAEASAEAPAEAPAVEPAPATPPEPEASPPDRVAADSPPVEPAPAAHRGADDGWGERLLADEGEAPATAPTAAPARRPAPSIEPDRAERAETSPAIRGRREGERIDDAWLAVGTGIHLRSGLEPKHTTDAFWGLRFDGRGFLRPLIAEGPWADLGVGFSVDFSLGLAYRYRGEDTWYDASQTQWRVELLYRWAQRAEWVPSLIAKLGVTGTRSTVADGAVFALDASYIGPHLGLDAVWNLRGPLLRGVLSLDALLAAAGGDLDATGGGLRFFLGLQSVVLGWFQLDVGYELTYYGFHDAASGSRSDTYHNALLRLGYVYE